MEQGKSEGFDSCDRPSNLKLDSNFKTAVNYILFCIASLPILTKPHQTTLYIDYSVTPSMTSAISGQGPIFTIYLWPRNPKLLKIHIDLICKMINRSGNNLAHALRAEHVQSCDLIELFIRLDWKILIFTYLPWTKWLPFPKQHFQMHFHEWKVFYFDSNFTEVCS